MNCFVGIKMAEPQQNSDDTVKVPNLNPPTIKIDTASEELATKTDEKILDEVKICSPALRPAAAPSPGRSRGILKPSQLALNTKFTLSPSRLNPARNSTEDRRTGGQQNGESLHFVPLVQDKTKLPNQTSTTNVTSTTGSTTTAPSFVFGQNLQERVVTADPKTEDALPSTSVNTSNGTDMLFSTALKNEVVKNDVTVVKGVAKSLSESAKEYEESRAVKRKYEEVEVITGEEEETNILSVSCKLFAFDKATTSWQERGRGTLRLNDFEIEDDIVQSRLVFRATGSLRVILNTKIWAEMTVEKANEKSIRLTALDANGEIKVFLIMANIEDTKTLYAQLQSRVQKEVVSQKHKKCHSTTGSSSNQ